MRQRWQDITSLILCMSVAVLPVGCKKKENKERVESSLNEGPGTAAPAPGKDAKVSDLSDAALDELVNAFDILVKPAPGQQQLQSDLFWCAIYALWSAFPAGKVMGGGKQSLKDLIKLNASTRGGRVVDIYNALNGLKKMATNDPVSMQQALTQAFSVMQLLNYLIGAAKPALKSVSWLPGAAAVSGVLNLADTFSQCGIAIKNGATQLIKDINAINAEYSKRQIWDASQDALGPVIGTPVFVVIVGGEAVTRTGEGIGDAIGSLAYPADPNIAGPTSTKTTEQCCTVNRTWEYWSGIAWRKCDWSGNVWLYQQSKEVSYPHENFLIEETGPRDCKGRNYSREDVRVIRSALDCKMVPSETCTR